MTTAQTPGRASLQLLAVAFVLLAGAEWAQAQRFQEVEARHLRHILVRTEAQADEVVAALEKGESFVALARKYSYDVRTKRLGGDLGWVTRGAGLDRDFENAAFAISEKGQWAKAKSVFGWFVVLLVDVRNEQVQLRPGQQPPRPPVTTTKPARTSKRDDYIEVKFKFEKKSSAPGDDLFVNISVRNNTEGREGVRPQSLDIPRPMFWPLGLTLRMQGQGGGRNRGLKLAGEAPATWAECLQRLEPGQQVSQRFRMQDYVPDGVLEAWPLVRVNWRGNILMANIGRLVSGVGEDTAFQKMSQRWRFYYGGEQHLNILPAYPNDERWFAVMDVNGGKVWMELLDPGVPGVLEHWISLVRAEHYDRFPFMKYEANEYILSGGAGGNEDGDPGKSFRLPAGWKNSVRGHDLDTVSLRVHGDRQGDMVGSAMYFCRERPQGLNQAAVPIGRLIGSERTIQLLMQAMAEMRKTSLTRIDLYPASLVHPRMREVLGLEANGEAATTKPKAAPQQPSKEQAVVTPKTAADEVGLADDLPRIMVATAQGIFQIELYEDDAPNTTAHFIELVESGFYAGSQFHRREGGDGEGFIQGGSPDGTSTGAIDYAVQDEISRRKHVRGAVALARLPSTRNSGSSQFYICLGSMPELDGAWTVFGRVVEGLDVVDRLQAGDYMKGMRIMHKRPHPYKAKRLPHPNAKKPHPQKPKTQQPRGRKPNVKPATRRAPAKPATRRQ
ncbi:MAG: peptidylprolyl isomerase [Planctomycetota bacterium]